MNERIDCPFKLSTSLQLLPWSWLTHNPPPSSLQPADKNRCRVRRIHHDVVQNQRIRAIQLHQPAPARAPVH